MERLFYEMEIKSEENNRGHGFIHSTIWKVRGILCWCRRFWHMLIRFLKYGIYSVIYARFAVCDTRLADHKAFVLLGIYVRSCDKIKTGNYGNFSFSLAILSILLLTLTWNKKKKYRIIIKYFHEIIKIITMKNFVKFFLSFRKMKFLLWKFRWDMNNTRIFLK